MSERPIYRPTDAECRCMVCGDRLVIPPFWLDTTPPDRRCPEGANIVTNCQRAMNIAKEKAWVLKTIAAQKGPLT